LGDCSGLAGALDLLAGQLGLVDELDRLWIRG
jgi:hypothetical protein